MLLVVAIALIARIVLLAARELANLSGIVVAVAGRLLAGFFALLAAGLGAAVLFLCGCFAAFDGFAYNMPSHRR